MYRLLEYMPYVGVGLLVIGIGLAYFTDLVSFQAAFPVLLFGAAICMFYFRRNARNPQRSNSFVWLAIFLTANTLVTALFGTLIYQNRANADFPLWVFAFFIVVLVGSSVVRVIRYARGEEVKLR